MQCPILFIALSGLASSTLAIDCYSCRSNSDDGCGESPDGSLLILNNKVESGCSACTKSFKALGTIWSMIERSCSMTSSKDECTNIFGYGECFCTTTFCNRATVLQVSSLFMLTLLIICHILSEI